MDTPAPKGWGKIAKGFLLTNLIAIVGVIVQDIRWHDGIDAQSKFAQIQINDLRARVDAQAVTLQSVETMKTDISWIRKSLDDITSEIRARNQKQ
jgi:hypothetical protein